MSKSAQKNFIITKKIPKPNVYVKAIYGDCKNWVFDEVEAPSYKGQWREKVFLSQDLPLNLEIGTGNGLHFSYFSERWPDKALLGMELKYKPLIQSTKRVMEKGLKNARMIRYNAWHVGDLFEEQELDDVMIFFPDPWPKGRKQKHRLLQVEFLEALYKCQKPSSFLEIKTDDRSYFSQIVKSIERSPYKIKALTEDLHHSEFSEDNFVTTFEKIFISKNQPIFYVKAGK